MRPKALSWDTGKQSPKFSMGRSLLGTPESLPKRASALGCSLVPSASRCTKGKSLILLLPLAASPMCGEELIWSVEEETMHVSKTAVKS